jgi:hypothetical protein
MAEKIKCVKLDVLMQCQRDIIERHIDQHKWFKHIPDKEAGVSDFIKQYAWLMRDLFCNYICDSKDGCKLRGQFSSKTHCEES